jgi:hypothetical protein
MARFGQGLIQGLINPGYGLNTTGMMAGGLAGSIAERRKEEDKKAKVAQTVSTLMQDDSPQRIRQGAAALFQDDPQAAAMLLDRAKEVAQRMAQLTGVPEGAARAEANAMQGRVRAASEKGMAERETTDKEQAKKNALSTYVAGQGASTLTPLVDAGVITGSNVNNFIKDPKETDWASIAKSGKYDPASVQAAKQTNDFSLLKPATGTTAASKITTREIYDPEQGRNVIAQMDQQGNIVGTLETPRSSPQDWSVDANKAYREIVDKAIEAQSVADNIANIQDELQDVGFTERGIAGSVRGSVRGALGIANAVDTAFADARALRVSNILQYLPPGVASDKDVELVLTTQLDPRNLSNEQRESWLNGYRKLKEQEALFNQRRAEWMTQNGGSQAGFLQKETQRKAETDINFFRRQRPNDFNNLISVIRSVEQLPQGSQERLIAEQTLQEKAEQLRKETKINVLQAIRNYQRVYNEN